MKYVRRDAIVQARVVEEEETYHDYEGRRHTAPVEYIQVTDGRGHSIYYPPAMFHREFIPADEVDSNG